ncbi:DUF1232 domain-containing protein [Oceanobacillus saliphilus]|uniref:DUF1232 domain-containing protein n=1 Tax=Oceanobacillus saliphilus TaxID=2925834 RepID=UPI00201D9A45|nr:DUF1232 domain-containing protein [Oceanobacillus saliphilus]
MESNNEFGTLLKQLLKEKALSMRKLSELTSIDTATISRIANGKRKANLNHMQKFSQCLDVPVTKLMKASGYPIDNIDKELPSETQASFRTLTAMLETSNLYQEDVSMEKIEQHIANYQEYSQTEQGKHTILTDFKEKLNKVGSIGPYIRHLEEMFDKFKDRNGTRYELALMGSALLYFIFTVDVIPDYIFPIGYLDDAIVVQTVLQLLRLK